MSDTVKITIIEDDNTILGLYRRAFIKADFSVEAHNNAEAIVEKVAKFKPDIVLTDLLMPKIDGYRTIRFLKSDTRTKNIPVVVISNLGDIVSQQKSAYLGAVDFIIKSNFTPSELVRRIRDVISGKIPKLEFDIHSTESFKADEGRYL
jgi:PleD family two-component response regulator